MNSYQGEAIKGRGTAGNIANRFRLVQRTATVAPDDEPVPETRVTRLKARTIISRNASPDVPFELSINPYQGCEHGCVYCFARPTHAYHDLSPGLDFETQLIAKVNAADRLEMELSAKSYRCKPITIGASTDPYQPIEREYAITRSLLECALRFKQPIGIITKSNLVERDIDLLQRLAADNLVSVMVSVTTLDDALKRQLEPRTPAGSRRVKTVQTLVDAGIPVGVLVAPMIPMINDMELESIVEAVATAGARSVGYVLLRLPLEVAPLFQAWLQQHYPQRAEHVLSLMRQMRGGQLYQARFGQRMSGQGAFAQLLAKRFEVAAKRRGLNRDRPALNTAVFCVPQRQARLF